MKKSIAVVMIASALTFSARAADTTVKITGVHLCCKGCVSGVEKAVAEVKGVTASVDKDAESVSLTGANHAAVQKAADALVAAGYFGKSSDTSIKLHPHANAKDKKVQSVKIEGVHLCCAKCVKAVDKALMSVPGVKHQTAEKEAKSFEVTGDFNEREVIAALHKAGLSGKVAE